MKSNKVEIREMSVEQLVEKIESLRRELFSLRLNAAGVKTKKVRKDIARALTYLRQKIS